MVQYVNEAGSRFEFKSSVRSSSPDYSRGEKVEVLYKPGNPEQAKIHSFFSLWGGISILGGLGALFFLVGAGLVVYPIIKGRKDKHLQENGRRIETVFQGVELNESYLVNDRHPFQLVTQWQNPATNKVHIFQSNNLWFDHTEYINRDRTTVFVETGDPASYYLDTSFLPEVAE